MAYKVLLVEDTEDVRSLYRLWLEQEGFQVIEAVDGLEMISILQLQQVHALVVDLAMPRVDGISAIHTLKAMPQHQSIIIIVVTALSDPDVQARAFAAGATEFLTKPLPVHEITDALRRHLA